MTSISSLVIQEAIPKHFLELNVHTSDGSYNDCLNLLTIRLLVKLENRKLTEGALVLSMLKAEA